VTAARSIHGQVVKGLRLKRDVGRRRIADAKLPPRQLSISVCENHEHRTLPTQHPPSSRRRQGPISKGLGVAKGVGHRALTRDTPVWIRDRLRSRSLVRDDGACDSPSPLNYRFVLHLFLSVYGVLIPSPPGGLFEGVCGRRSRVVLASVADAKPSGGALGPTGRGRTRNDGAWYRRCLTIESKDRARLVTGFFSPRARSASLLAS
jgi:hypothetical protein